MKGEISVDQGPDAMDCTDSADCGCNGSGPWCNGLHRLCRLWMGPDTMDQGHDAMDCTDSAEIYCFRPFFVVSIYPSIDQKVYLSYLSYYFFHSIYYFFHSMYSCNELACTLWVSRDRHRWEHKGGEGVWAESGKVLTLINKQSPTLITGDCKDPPAGKKWLGTNKGSAWNCVGFWQGC